MSSLARRGNDTCVSLVGGPLNGKTVNYAHPLPKILVVAQVSELNKINYLDYERIARSRRYQFKAREDNEGEE